MADTVTSQSRKELTTSCDKCIFAEYIHEEQIGCRARTLDGGDYFITYKDGRSYWVYDGLCQFKRLEGWTSCESIEERLHQVYKEVRINYNAIIYHEDLEKTVTLVEGVKKQTLKPQRLILVSKNTTNEELQRLAIDSGLKWTIHEMLDDEVPDWRDQIIQQYPAQLYAFLTGVLPSSYFFNLNDAINFERLRFGAISGSNALIVPNGLYRMITKPLRLILDTLEEIGVKELNEDFSPKK